MRNLSIGVFSLRARRRPARECLDLNKPNKKGGSGSTGGIEHSKSPRNKLHYKSLTPGLTTQLPVLSSATGVLGYW